MLREKEVSKEDVELWLVRLPASVACEAFDGATFAPHAQLGAEVARVSVDDESTSGVWAIRIVVARIPPVANTPPWPPRPIIKTRWSSQTKSSHVVRDLCGRRRRSVSCCARAVRREWAPLWRWRWGASWW